MGKSREIRSLIRSIAGAGSGTSLFFPAQVTEADGETCRAKIGDLEISGIRCGSVADGNENNLKIKPAVGSTVLLADLSGGTMREMAVIAYSRIDALVFDGGSNGGMVKAPELQKQLKKLTGRVDGIMDAIKNAVPGANDGGTSLQATMKAALAKITDKENFSSIENEKIRH
jgi:hypothetical protein